MPYLKIFIFYNGVFGIWLTKASLEDILFGNRNYLVFKRS